MKKSLKNAEEGFSLIELVIGTVIAGIVIVAAMNFSSGVNKFQTEANLKILASTDLQAFVKNRRKSLARFTPANAITRTPAVAAGTIPAPNSLTLTIPRTTVNPTTMATTIDNEVITINCAAVPAAIAPLLPPGYTCGGVCGSGKAPVSVSISVNGQVGETYPAPLPSAFPDGVSQRLAMSLCMSYDDTNNLVQMSATYLLRPSPETDRFQTVNESFAFTVPRPPPPGQAAPQVLGNF